MAQIQVSDVIADITQQLKGCPGSTVVRAYVRAARRFCLGSRWLRRTIEGVTVASPATSTYSLGNDPFVDVTGIVAASIEGGDGKWVPLSPADSTTWDPEEEAAQPELYQFLPAAQFALHPTPDAVYALKVAVALSPKRGANSLDDALVTHWEYALEDGALGYLLQMPKPWADPGRGKECEARFLRTISSASINAEFGFNPGAQPTEESGAGGQGFSTSLLRI